MRTRMKLGTVLAALVAVSAMAVAPAEAKVKRLPSEVAFVGTTATPDLELRVTGESSSCLKGRTIVVRDDTSVIATVKTDASGDAAVTYDEWFYNTLSESFTAELQRGKKFGKPKKQKQCLGDSAALTADRIQGTINNFAINNQAKVFQGTVTSPDQRCYDSILVNVISDVESPRSGTTNASGAFSIPWGFPTLSQGQYQAQEGGFVLSENYTPDGNGSIVACELNLSNILNYSG
jgi:hypothetical protein